MKSVLFIFVLLFIHHRKVAICLPFWFSFFMDISRKKCEFDWNESEKKMEKKIGGKGIGTHIWCCVHVYLSFSLLRITNGWRKKVSFENSMHIKRQSRDSMRRTQKCFIKHVLKIKLKRSARNFHSATETIFLWRNYFYWD